MNPAQIVEAVLFASDAPLQVDEIARADENLDEDAVEAALQRLRTEYDEMERAFQVVEVAEGYQLLTRPEFSTYLERFDTVPRPSRLSGPALETLAIIAYRQPIGRVEIEYVRGVGASGVIRSLADRGLIEVVGRAEGLGRPLLYGTTRRFLDHFGFSSLEELPRPEELPVVLRERVPLGPQDPDEEVDPNQVPMGLAGAILGVAGEPSGARERASGAEGGAPANAARPADAGELSDADGADALDELDELDDLDVPEDDLDGPDDDLDALDDDLEGSDDDLDQPDDDLDGPDDEPRREEAF